MVRSISGISVEQRYQDGYINATKLSNAHRQATGQRREPSEWLNNQRTKQTLEHLSRSTGIPVDLLIVTVTTGKNENRGTYIHPRLAVRFGIWLSDDFGFLVEQWVEEWTLTGRNPFADTDRVGLRGTLKDESRLRMSDEVKTYLEQIKRYDDRRYRGQYFAKVNNLINKLITTETAQNMRDRLSKTQGRKISDAELIRDYFPTSVLKDYINLCEVSANLMIKDGLQPISAVERAAELTLPAGYQPKPIDFVEHIKFVRQRLEGQQQMYLE